MTVVLDLAVDASGVRTGGQQAEAALTGVTRSAEKTQTSLATIGGGIRNTFQAVQGVSQVGQGLNSTVSAFDKMNYSMGAFAASRLLLEVGKTTDDFRQMAGTVQVVTRDVYGMTSATTRAASGFEVLKAAMLTHPILTIATAIGAAAGLMALFSSNTQKAARSFDDLVASMERSKLDERVAKLLGAGAGDERRTQMKRLEEAAGYAVAYQGGVGAEGLNVERVSRMLGYSQMDIVRGLARLKNPYALEYIDTGAFTGEYLPGADFKRRQLQEPQVEARYITMTPEQLRSLIAGAYQNLQRQPMYAGGPGGYFSMIPHQGFGIQDQFGLGIGRDYVNIRPEMQEVIDRQNYLAEMERRPIQGVGAAGTYFSMVPPREFGIRDQFGLGIGRDYVGIRPEQQAQIDRENRLAAQEKITASMERAAQYAEQIGASLGAATWDVLAGAQGVRQALISILNSLGRQSLSSLGATLFGATVRQVQGNTNPTPGELPGVYPR